MTTSLSQPDKAAPPDSGLAGRLHDTIHRFLVQPADAGIVGSVDGGKLLEWIDKAGYAAAAQWSGHYCVTAYVGNIHLDRPISIGELVELHATLVYTGRTAMHILVTVYSTDPTRAKPVQTSQCLTIFVAVDDDGRPVEVPHWTPDTILELQRHRQARARIPMRKQIETAMAAEHYTPESTAPQATLRFLAAPTDINWGGKVHGGRVMRWIDEAGYVCGAQWAQAQVIASYVGGIRFYRPIIIGHIIEVTARLIHTGRRSIHTSVHVTTSYTNAGTPILAAHALAVFVALDDKGKAQPMRKWEPVSKEDHRLDQHARDLIGLRELVEPFTSSASVPADAEPNCYHLNTATT